MTRKTIKYRQGMTLAKRLQLPCVRMQRVPTNERLYTELMQQGYHWSAESCAFKQGTTVNSVFRDPLGEDSGEFRVRVRAARQTAAQLVTLLEDVLPKYGYRITSESAQEADTSGASVRVYLQGKVTVRKRGR